jgi:hypothetical protein
MQSSVSFRALLTMSKRLRFRKPVVTFAKLPPRGFRKSLILRQLRRRTEVRSVASRFAAFAYIGKRI